MQKPPLDPSVADRAPEASCLTGYDEQHLITYLRLLDAEADGADWREVARIVLHRDPAADPEGVHRCWHSHLARAHWMSSDRISRLILALRTLDGLDSGVSQREIAGVLFDHKVSATDWLSHDLHFRMKRLVRFARGLADGGYRRLLRHPFRGR